MPPSLRRRGQQPPLPQFHESVSESDSDQDLQAQLEEDVLPEAETVMDEDDDDEEDIEGEEEGDALGSQDQLFPPESPIPPNFREISTLASWTVSSSKPGCSIPQLRNPNTSLFWQSDGPQPHYLNIHFFKLVRIVGLRLYLDFEADESYTPTRIVFLAGSGNNDLVEWGEMRLEQPRGWVWADFEGVGEAESDSDEDEEEQEAEEGGNEHGEERGPFSRPIPAFGPNTGDEELENAQPSVYGAEDTSFAIGTPSQALHSSSSPTMQRNARSQQRPQRHPRGPLLDLPPNLSPRVPVERAKKQKMPVLRAHLVQIKILENHQNGKDTHLRGLQIFALDTEKERREVRARRSVGGDGGRKSIGATRNMGGALPLRGLSRSSWDVEPNIR